MIHDALVVGAGLSGLVCARRLADAGARTLVLEARPRVGGRLHSGALGDAVVDLGGQWMSVDQPRLLALAVELGVSSVPQPRDGRAILDDSARGRGLFAQLGAAFAQWRAVRRIARMMRALPTDVPGSTAALAALDATGADPWPAGAAALDAIAFGPWLAGTIPHAVARERLALHADLVFATDPASLSLLSYLARLRVTGGFAPRGPDLPGGGREHRFVGGAQTLALRLAEGLGDAVRTGSPVQAIEFATGPVPQSATGSAPASATESATGSARESATGSATGFATGSATGSARESASRSATGSAPEPQERRSIALATGPLGRGVLAVRTGVATHLARHVVLALPPPLAAMIAPSLPGLLRRLAASMHRGAVVKCFAAYRRPFWREAGLSGEAFCPRGTVRAVVDATTPDGPTAVLLAFVVGRPAVAWRDRAPDDRRAEVLAALGALFGEPARTPEDYVEADWAAEPWSAGCVASTPPGALTGLAAGARWRGSIGRIHLAGAEAAVLWPGYMEGAIEAGERAAAAVLADGDAERLSRPRSAAAPSSS